MMADSRSTILVSIPKHCPNCGYDLAYCRGGRCSECGMLYSESSRIGRGRRIIALLARVMLGVAIILLIAAITVYVVHLPSIMADQQIRRRAEVAGWHYETRNCTSRLRALCRQVGGYEDSEIIALQCAYSTITTKDSQLFGSLHYLHTLDLRGCVVSESIVKEIGQCHSLVGLNLHRSSFQSQHLIHVGGLTNLKAFIVDTGVLHDGSIKSIEGFTKLESIILGGDQVSDESMSVVRKLVGLRRIVLSETAVTTSGISELGILPRLERISIYRGDRLTVGLVDVLAGFDALKRVELVSIPCVSQASVERLRTERPDLSVSVTY